MGEHDLARVGRPVAQLHQRMDQDGQRGQPLVQTVPGGQPGEDGQDKIRFPPAGGQVDAEQTAKAAEPAGAQGGGLIAQAACAAPEQGAGREGGSFVHAASPWQASAGKRVVPGPGKAGMTGPEARRSIASPERACKGGAPVAEPHAMREAGQG